MKNTLRQVVRSPKFMTGFIIIMALLLFSLVYPLVVPGDPLEHIGVGTFFKPGTYISTYDTLEASTTYILRLEDAAANRVATKLSADDRKVLKEWLVAYGLPPDAVDEDDTETLLELWINNYDESLRLEGMTQAVRRQVSRAAAKLDGLLDSEDYIVMQENEEGELVEKKTVTDRDYAHYNDIANIIYLPLGTDNFGRDQLKQLVSAVKTSLLIGLVAGSIATAIGLTLGLIAGYVGGIVDDIIMFVANCFTVIPGFILLILISYSIGQESRGALVVAVTIGLTSWVWTTRSVRAQVVSLRNRDHVNLSKLSGHSLPRIVLTDILPYIASYVIMAFILQICSGILAEAQLSMLGLGPKTTEVPTLGLMMNWATSFAAHLNGSWWAYFPVIITIALISFSLNLMNTGLDQVFNPQLRD